MESLNIKHIFTREVPDGLVMMLGFRNTSLFKRTSRFYSIGKDYRLICGLEIHTQLNTENKLFSLSTNAPFKSLNTPNKHVSHFDASLPGTRPRLNYECVLGALKLASSLNCNINLNSHFDRKHYFYGDQPQGYQLTQHYSPIATEGYMTLHNDIDNIDTPTKIINIIQLQLEQDTGMSHYDDYEKTTMIDLNRSNVPLIELVTKPDFTTVPQVIAFIKKYQNLVRNLDICTGNLETGAIRVDVNISVDTYPRVEVKNLPNTSSISNAIKYEYMRQVNIIKDGKASKMLNCQETRGWNGKETVKLRSKETTIDYRYMPDPELGCVALDPSILVDIKRSLPISSDNEIRNLMGEPYNLTVKNAKLLCMHNEKNEQYTNDEVKNYYLSSFNLFERTNPKLSPKDRKIVANWVINELLGNLNKLELTLHKVEQLFPPNKFVEFIQLLKGGIISNTGGKTLLFHILESIKNNTIQENLNIPELVKQLKIEVQSSINEDELLSQCKAIIEKVNNNDPKLIEGIISGKKRNSLNYLVGIAMKETRGRVKATEYQRLFKCVLKVE